MRRAYTNAFRALVLLIVCAGLSTARSDTIHLKNGASIAADSWEDRGDALVIRQAGGAIVVPKSDIARVERTPPVRPAGPAAPAAPVPAGTPASGDGEKAEDLIRRLEELKRRLEHYPLARAENTRQIVALLDRLGLKAYSGRDYDDARARFTEALGYDQHDALAQRGLAASYLALEQDIYARSTLERALLDHPDDPDLLSLLGDVYNIQERPEEALAAWRRAYEIRPAPALKAKIDKLQREHGVEERYRRSEAAHFTLKYDGERSGSDLESQILDALEGEFSSLVTRFDHYPSQPIVVIVYPQRQFYEATQAESSVGGLYDGKIRVPIGGLGRLTLEARKVLLHELAHAFIAGKSRKTAPRWLHEGLAQWVEGKSISPAQGVSLAKEYRDLSERSAWGTTFSYPSALSLVEYLIEREGLPRIVDVLEAMAGGFSEEAAFRQETRESLADLRQAWGGWLVSRHLQ